MASGHIMPHMVTSRLLDFAHIYGTLLCSRNQ